MSHFQTRSHCCRPQQSRFQISSKKHPAVIRSAEEILTSWAWHRGIASIDSKKKPDVQTMPVISVIFQTFSKPHPSIPSKLHHPKFLEVDAKDLPWETIAAWISSVQPSLMASSTPIPAERLVNDPLIQKENHKVANSLSCLAPSKHMVPFSASLWNEFFLHQNKICPHIDQLFQVDSKCHTPHSSSLTNRPWSWVNFQQASFTNGCRVSKPRVSKFLHPHLAIQEQTTN